MAAGIKANFGTMVKPLHVGQCARNGLLAVLLAKQGYDANPNSLEHVQGFFNVFNGEGTFDTDKLFEDWALPLEIEGNTIALKQFPCCGSTHPAITMMLQLRQEESMSTEDIEKIEVLKGGGSVQYGSDALGGTIQVFTAEPEFGSKLKVNLLGRIATQGMEQTTRGELNYGGEKLAISGSFGYRNFGDLIGGKITGRQSPSGYDEQMGNLKAKLKLGKGILTMAHQYFEAKNVPIYHKVVLENFAMNEFQPQRRNLSYVKFNQKNASKIFSDVSVIGSLQMTYEGRKSQKKHRWYVRF
jgi:hypothetical protein